jgi:hypothetical protein
LDIELAEPAGRYQERRDMSDKIKRALTALAALTMLALGGAAIAGATGDSGSQDQGAAVENESDGNEAADDQGGDGDGELPAAADQKARAAAEQATGGQANGDVEPAEQADPVEDPNDQPTPEGAAYEVEITKDGQALKVFLDSSFNAIETQQDAG